MTKEQYIQKILKKIKATKDIRERIGSDLRTEIDTRLEVGATMEEIIKEKGMPDEVAKGFNQTYCDTAMRRQFQTARALKAGAITCFAAALLIFLLNGIAKLAFSGGASVASIGGADAPTEIYVTGGPLAMLPDQFTLGNIIGGIVLAVSVLCFLALLLYNRKQKQ